MSASHGGHGHETTDAPKASTFYTLIAIMIGVAFALGAAAILIFGNNEKPLARGVVKEVVHGTTITEDASVYLPNEMDLGQHHYYTVMPDVTFTAKSDPYEWYPYSTDQLPAGVTAVDDEGNESFRAGTTYVTFTNKSSKAFHIGIGRCKTTTCNINFDDPSQEAGISSIVTGSSDEDSNPWKTTFYWLAFVLLVVLVYYAIEFLVAKFNPNFWVGEDTRKEEKTKHHKSDHDDHGDDGEHSHHGDKNGVHPGFFVTLLMSLLFGTVTLVAFGVYDGVEKLYALVPFMAFAWFTNLIYYNGFVVDAHVTKGIYSRFSKEEVTAYGQGDAFVLRTSYIVGTPADQGLANTNLDNEVIDLMPEKAEDAQILFDGGAAAQIRKAQAVINVIEGSGSEWLTRFKGGTVESIKGYIKDLYWASVGVVATSTSLEKVLSETGTRTVKGVDEDALQFCIDIDEQMEDVFKRVGIKLHFHSTMAQPKPLGKLEDAMRLKATLKKAKEIIAEEYKGLTPQQQEKAARIWLGISTENYDIKGLDRDTLAHAVELAKTIFGDKK